MQSQPLVVFLETASVPWPLAPLRGAVRDVRYTHTAPGQVLERLHDATVAVVNKLPLRADTLAGLPQLRLVAITATGTDNVDLVACRERGIVVCNVQDYAVHSVPEHTMMLMLALRRRLFDYVSDVRAGLWQQSGNFCLFNHRVGGLYGARLGLVGHGSLGAAVAELARAFGMEVLLSEHPGAETVRPGRLPFSEVLKQSDVLSLHCPLTNATRGLIGREQLASMKSGAILINTGRGGLIDEAALADALRTGVLAGAAVDVLSAEPPVNGNPLLAADIPNLIMTPHVAWASEEALQSLAAQVIENIEAYLEGAPRRRVA